MLRPTRQTRLDLCRSERSAAGPVRCAAWGCPAAPRAKPQPCGRGDAAGKRRKPPRYENGMDRVRCRGRGPRVDGAAVRSQRQLPDHEHPRQHDRARHADGSTVQARLPVGARPRRDHDGCTARSNRSHTSSVGRFFPAFQRVKVDGAISASRHTCAMLFPASWASRSTSSGVGR